MMKGTTSRILRHASLLCVTTFSGLSYAAEITSVQYGQNGDGKIELQIIGKDLVGIQSFNLTNPARIVIDIPNGKSFLKNRSTPVNKGQIQDIVVIEGDNRARATINLSNIVAYEVIDNNSDKITVLIKDNTANSKATSSSTAKVKQPSSNVDPKIDFTRGAEGQGVLSIDLANEDIAIDVRSEGNQVIAESTNAEFPKSVQKRFKVTDFGTKVKSIDILKNKVIATMVDDNFEYVSYQSDDLFTLEFNEPQTEEDKQAQEFTFGENKRYEGEPLSLNFQDIEVRAVIQLIADFTKSNIVVSDEVSGNITLRLNNVPWDQALDIILKTKGLSKRESNEVIYIAPTGTLVNNETQELTGYQKREELSPLKTELIQVQYARAEALEEIITDDGGNSGGGERNNNRGFLSNRGNISVDERTNTILVQDIPSRIAAIRALIADLDVPVNQVLVDSRIVAASDDFSHELGVQFGGAFVGTTDDYTFGGTGSLSGQDTILGSAAENLLETGQALPATIPSLGDRLGVALPASNPTGSIGLGILGADFLVDLELSALQDEGRGEVISSPRVITQDGADAYIEQGVEIPYSTVGDDGSVQVQFKQANLSLSVTPKIAPNNMVDMILEITKDTIGASVPTALGSAVPSINTNSIQTQVLVDNGETVVLGGIYEQTKQNTVSKVPLLGDIPVIGRLFRKDTNSVTKDELLIFVTPRIIDKRFIESDKFSSLSNSK